MEKCIKQIIKAGWGEEVSIKFGANNVTLIEYESWNLGNTNKELLFTVLSSGNIYFHYERHINPLIVMGKITSKKGIYNLFDFYKGDTLELKRDGLEDLREDEMPKGICRKEDYWIHIEGMLGKVRMISNVLEVKYTKDEYKEFCEQEAEMMFGVSFDEACEMAENNVGSDFALQRIKMLKSLME